MPATIYDDGHSIEIYTGRVAIDVFSDTLAHALAAARRLVPVNAPGSATGPLPPPVYCPGLSGPVTGARGAGDGLAARAGSASATPRAEQAFAASACTPSPASAAGTAGRPISRRRLRNATEPSSAGTHSEIAR